VTPLESEVPANTLFAPDVSAGQLKLIPEQVGQQRSRFDEQVVDASVDGDVKCEVLSHGNVLLLRGRLPW
jgi:hypothetical protein